MPASSDSFSIEQDLLGPACRSVGAGRDHSTPPPFGESRQAVVLLRHLEQTPLVLDGVRG